MTPDPYVIFAPQTVAVRIELEPAYNGLTSLALLNVTERFSGLGEWVVQTASALSEEQRHDNRLVFEGLFSVTRASAGGWDSFPAYLEYLAGEDACRLRDQGLEYLLRRSGVEATAEPTDLLADRELYLQHVRAYYHDDVEIDPDLHSEAHALLNDPPAMQALLISHLGAMWESVLAEEWERVLPLLRDSVAAFRRLNTSGLTPFEAIRLVTGRDLKDVLQADLSTVRTLIFVPSAHIGPYVTLHISPDGETVRVAFGARTPEGVPVHSPALSRSELLVRLNALADDTRLRILELLSTHGELRAQDIMTRLGLSQSSASRHLRQLSATGYLTERRREGGKWYSLNADRLNGTLDALRRFLKIRG
ncbi:MAG TPA: ArsR family transcriptional regulator [Chloroflexi bacterium]|nr:ArsR family transcriptional regulator [Chloroflexota bacterium]